MRKPRNRLLPRDELRPSQGVLACQAVVEREPDAVVRQMAALVQGHEDRQLPDQVRCNIHERLALAQRLPDQPELGPVHVLDRLLQIADAAVHELGAAAAGAAAEVSALHQGDPQPRAWRRPARSRIRWRPRRSRARRRTRRPSGAGARSGSRVTKQCTAPRRRGYRKRSAVGSETDSAWPPKRRYVPGRARSLHPGGA